MSRRLISGCGNVFARVVLGMPVHECTTGSAVIGARFWNVSIRTPFNRKATVFRLRWPIESGNWALRSSRHRLSLWIGAWASPRCRAQSSLRHLRMSCVYALAGCLCRTSRRQPLLGAWLAGNAAGRTGICRTKVGEKFQNRCIFWV